MSDSITIIEPLYDRVIVRRTDDAKGTTPGAKVKIADVAKEIPQEGEVIAAGAGKRKENGELIPLFVSAGDRVMFGKYSGTEIKVADEQLLIMREDEIFGIIRRGEASR